MPSEHTEFIPLLTRADHWEFPRERLRLSTTLGTGAFGMVMRGDAQGIRGSTGIVKVAVKIPKGMKVLLQLHHFVLSLCCKLFRIHNLFCSFRRFIIIITRFSNFDPHLLNFGISDPLLIRTPPFIWHVRVNECFNVPHCMKEAHGNSEALCPQNRSRSHGETSLRIAVYFEFTDLSRFQAVIKHKAKIYTETRYFALKSGKSGRE